MVERVPEASQQIYFVSIGRIRDQTMLATCKTSNQIPVDQDQDIRDHSMALLCRANNTMGGGRFRSVHLGYAWHQFHDKNNISYLVVTHPSFPDEFANNFLRGLSEALYEKNAEFRRNPNGIQSLDGMARHVIVELQSTFDGSPNFAAANLDIEAGSAKTAGI